MCKKQISLHLLSFFLLKAGNLLATNSEALNDFRNTLLIKSISKKDIITIKYLIIDGANPNTQNKYGTSALMIAAEKGHRR